MHKTEEPGADAASEQEQFLMIAARFPPVNSAGVYRSVFFCANLPKFGWEPLVLTSGGQDPNIFSGGDDSLLGLIGKNTLIKRVPYPHNTLWRKAEPRMTHFPFRRLRNYLVDHIDFPCNFRQWARRAYRPALKVIKENRPKLIYCTMTPWSCWFLADRLSRKTGLPWVADFRDPWYDHAFRYQTRTERRREREGELERRLASSAHHIVMAHPIGAEKMSRRYNIPSEKISVITNGYNPDDFKKGRSKEAHDDRLKIVHVGTPYKNNSPAPLFRALDLAAEKAPELLRSLSVRFVGGCHIDPPQHKDLSIEIEANRVPHPQAIQEMLDADVLLLVFEKSLPSYMIPGKLFEYLGARKPILAIIPQDSDSGRIVRETESGVVLDPDKPEEIIKQLEDWAAQKPRLQENREALKKYERVKQAEMLAGVFEKMVKQD